MKWLRAAARITGLVALVLASFYVWSFGLASPLAVRCGWVRGTPGLVQRYHCYPEH